MRGFLGLAAPFVAVFFLAGLGWGVWSQHSKRDEMRTSEPLRVLCAEHWLSEARLKEFSQTFSIPVQLYTYSRPNELLRQIANSGGRIDVICTSSLLLKSLVQGQWLLKGDYLSLPNSRLISVDFLHLPYDARSEFGLPLFWNLYGFFGREKEKEFETQPSWRSVWNSRKVGLWGEELNLLHSMSRAGIEISGTYEARHPEKFEEDAKKFLKRIAKIWEPDPAPVSAEAALSGADWIQLPLARVARLLGENSPYKFWLPEDGGAIEVGLLAVGAKSGNVKMAKELINSLLTTDHALEVHRRLNAGSVHATLNNSDAVAIYQRADALRRFPLNRFSFPDLDIETLPRFEKIIDSENAASGGNSDSQ